ncbi:hypothetical protein AJ78_05706 [Emergomyces pasteurianus Ep9510]|uniref:Protein SQS1 n=1 Tax=Emergomyces pasteurianus Ep9510 TaxID=1447872 RepID=A0A1J9QFC3_9EURO|nr:hypothetical protein AJ78_05706 [Emergomyces pasteurianus Ep9510]
MARPKKSKARRGGGYSSGSPDFVVATRQSSTSQYRANHANARPHVGFKQDETHLTMTQEARNTEHFNTRRSNLKLRYSEIRFVSAGDMVQENLEVPNEDSTDIALNGTPSNIDATSLGMKDVYGDCRRWLSGIRQGSQAKEGKAEEEEGEKSETMTDGDSNSKDLLFIDREGEDPKENMRNEHLIITPDVRSVPQSDSSEDEVVFTGRRRRSQQSPAHQAQNPPLNPACGPSIQNDRFPVADGDDDYEDDDDGHEVVASPQMPASSNESDPAIISEPALCHPANPPAFISLKGKEKRSRTRKPRRPTLHWDSDDSEILADYIANMVDDDTSDEDEDEDAGVGQVHAQNQNQNQTGHFSTKSWSSADLEDLNDLSSSDELPDEIGRIFSMRERNKSIQYLLTGVGQSTDEARWVRKELLIMPGASELIRQFEERVALNASRQEVASEPSSDLDEEGEEDEVDHYVDEDMKQDLIDEQMAHLLQTQDSFGLGANELLLFDGNGGFDRFESISRSKFSYKTSLSQPKKRQNRNGHFPCASAFADVLDQDPYGGFDIMDFDRPSLKKKPKGRRYAHQHDFDLSDSDLVYELQASWENDRNKKKAKKQEREELRAQGLLGTKPGKINMKAKYTEGMSIDDVKQEIRSFLTSSSESLALPPMDKRNRKLVHEIANILSLKSLSRGSGTSRFPILTKTSRTPVLEGQAAVYQVDRIFSSGRFMRRMDRSQRGAGGPKSVVKSRGGGGLKAASYMDGDVVGASAPEIGAENKGRAMLEKMGWSTGTALGADNNKGILHPVVHVVKNTKAGLG